MNMYLRGTFATSVSRFFAFLFFSRRKESVGWYFVFRWLKTYVKTGIGGAREFVETSLATEGVLRRHRSDFILLQRETIMHFYSNSFTRIDFFKTYITILYF